MHPPEHLLKGLRTVEINKNTVAVSSFGRFLAGVRLTTDTAPGVWREQKWHVPIGKTPKGASVMQFAHQHRCAGPRQSGDEYVLLRLDA